MQNVAFKSTEHRALVLIGGDPGIGKSPLVQQALSALARAAIVLYVSGEESPQQIKMRADRLGVSEDRLFVLAESSLGRVIEHVKKLAPLVLVIDAIQTMFTDQRLLSILSALAHRIPRSTSPSCANKSISSCISGQLFG